MKNRRGESARALSTTSATHSCGKYHIGGTLLWNASASQSYSLSTELVNYSSGLHPQHATPTLAPTTGVCRRQEDEKRHEAALQKERQHRREWEARSDKHVRDKREQAKQHREEMRRQVAAERKRAEGEARKKLEARHRETQQKAEEVRSK